MCRGRLGETLRPCPATPTRSSSPGATRPVPDETTLAGLTVEGTLPIALSGQYVRIGPNPVATTATPCGWHSLDGMVHGVALHADPQPFSGRSLTR